MVVVAVLLAATQGFRWVRDLGRRRALLLGLAAALITVNWGGYIYGVNSGHVVETSLGYFINPLVTVALAVTRRRRAAAARRSGSAVAIAAAGGRRADRRLRPAAVDRADARVLVRLLRAGQEAGRRGRDAEPRGRDRRSCSCPRWPACICAAGDRQGDARPPRAPGHALLLAGGGIVDRDPADALRRRRRAHPADDDRAAAVPRADHAVRDRRRDPRTRRCPRRAGRASCSSGSRSSSSPATACARAGSRPVTVRA